MKTKLSFLLVLMFLATLSFSQVFEKQRAGVTIITHGWNPSGGEPGWLQTMANAIIARSGGNRHIAKIAITGTTRN